MSERRLGMAEKAYVAGCVVRSYLRVRTNLHREPLPTFTRRLTRAERISRRHHAPRRLSRAVHRTLCWGRLQPTCLIKALVLFDLLNQQGDAPEVVIGLPERPT